MKFIFVCSILLFLTTTTPSQVVSQSSEETVEDSTNQALETKIQLAELHRLESEQYKISLEAKEIERRLNQRWWEGHKLTEYIIAILFASVLLFGWTRVYLEPILKKQSEVNKLAEERNAIQNELLENQNKLILQQQNDITSERDLLKQEGEKLKAEREKLVKEQGELKLRVKGLDLAIHQAAKKGEFFSILNRKDPINELKNSYGWKIGSDNYFGKFGYYLMARHENVRSHKRNLIVRITEFENLVTTLPEGWCDYIKKILNHQRGGPLLVLDYSYFGLLVDKDVPVGGKIYTKDKEAFEFYAPLSKWSECLADLLKE